MNKIEVIYLQQKEDLLKILVKERAIYIGSGETGSCFLLKDKTVLKIYNETDKKRDLFQLNYPMLEHIKLLSTLKNESYITPEVVFVCNGEVVAYKAEYRNAKTLEKIKFNMRIQAVLANLDKFIEDTYLIGEKNFRLQDSHNRNILFNYYFYMIDLDFGYNLEESIDQINKFNIRGIMEVLLRTLFQVKDYEMLIINEPSLFKLYNKSIYEDYKNIYPFFELLKEAIKVSDLQVKHLRLTHNGLISKEYNSYYKP